MRILAACLVSLIALSSSCARGSVAASRMMVPRVDVVAIEQETPRAPEVAWATSLPALHLHNVNTLVDADVKLYAPSGEIDEAAARAIDRVFAPKDGEPRPGSRRLMQLLVKAAAHFHATEVTVLSSWRPSARKGSRHASGEALDFMLVGVKSSELAAHLRTYAKVGVGIYTHPRTGFVHLDVRDESFHWLDASPPGRTWKERGITDRAAAARDAAYTIEQDLPG